MLRHSLDEQLEDSKALWTPNLLGVVVCVTWMMMVIKSAVFLHFAEEPKLFAVYFFFLFPTVYCVERAMRELHRSLKWLFGWIFGWLDNFLEETSFEDAAFPVIFMTTTTFLSIGTTILLFYAAEYLAGLLP